MAYRGGQLVDLAPPLEQGVRRFARRTTGKVGEELRKRVRRHTPIASPGTPEIRASYESSAMWIRARGGRRPGTLYESWEVGEVTVSEGAGGEVFTVPVLTHDPVAPHVEWDTMPHLIFPRGGGVLTIPTRFGMVFAKMVMHPGTRGSHMMATGLAEIGVEWQRVAEREWRQESRDLWRLARRGG